MTLKLISKNNVPTYIAETSDIDNDTIVGASIIGGTIFMIDDGTWRIIAEDLTLSVYGLPVSVSTGTITIGQVEIANGGDATQGAVADSAVITDTSGTISGKLRGLVKWAFERMPTSLGQKTSAASFPVVLPSNQVVSVSGSFSNASLEVSPVAQLSTNSYADVVGSGIDALNYSVMAYTIQNTDIANSITWQVVAANDTDFSDAIIVGSPITVSALATSSYVASPAPYRYYKVQIKGTVALTAGTGFVHGIAKG